MVAQPDYVEQKVARLERIESLGLVARKAMVLQSIAQRLAHADLEGNELGRGPAGPALFFFECYKRLRKEDDLELARYHLARVLDGIDQVHSFDLYAGFAGVGWLLNHLRTLDTEDELELASDCCADVDELLLDLAGERGWPHHYDLIAGLVGVGVYAISHPDADVRTRLFTLVADRLIEMSEQDEGGTTWRSQNRFLPSADERMRYPHGNFNLGLAHGVPGVVALLAQAAIKGVDRDRCAPLLRSSTNWLLSAGGAGPVPSYGFHAGDGQQARIAWCYGDLSASVALLRAARALDDPRLSDVAIAVATTTLNRRLADSGVQDASLCHGSQGNAHLYRRLFGWTGYRRFLEASLRWEAATLEPWLMSPETSEGMFLPCKWVDTWKQEGGYLMGLSGIGLSLAEGLYGLSGSWDVPMMTER